MVFTWGIQKDFGGVLLVQLMKFFLPRGVMDFALHVGPPLANLLTALWLFQKTTKPLTSSIHCQFIRRWK